MNQAQHARIDTARPLADEETDRPPALDEQSVLDMLVEGEADDYEGSYRPLVGIRNGLLIGLGFWAIVLAALGVVAGLGYL